MERQVPRPLSFKTAIERHHIPHDYSSHMVPALLHHPFRRNTRLQADEQPVSFSPHHKAKRSPLQGLLSVYGGEPGTKLELI